MSTNDSLFLDMEEDYAMVTAHAVCKTLGLYTAGSLDDIIMDAEIELDRRQTEARNMAMGIKALMALRPAKPPKGRARSKAKQTYDDMLTIMDVLLEAGVSMSTVEILACGLDIPKKRACYALEILALDDKIGLGAGGWEIQRKSAPSGAAG